MRRYAALLFCLSLLACPALADDQPTYHNDRAIKAKIQNVGAKLFKEGKATPAKTLQQQLNSRKTYDAKPPALFSLTEDGKDVYDKVDDGVLVISRLYLCGKCDKLHSSDASGYVISKEGLAVTNHHVMKGKGDMDKTWVATTRDGRVVPIVEVLAASAKYDTALIRLGGKNFSPVPVARTASVGERVHSVTNPHGRYFTYSSGEISRFFMKNNRGRRVAVTCDYGGGSSGGPIFNDKGQVVAMVSEAVVVPDKKVVFYDSVPYACVLELFKKDDNGKDRQAKKD